VQAFPSLLSPPPPRTFLRPPQFSRGQKSEKCIERAESLTETLATQANSKINAVLRIIAEHWQNENYHAFSFWFFI